ncbi:hypothetical protein ILUMI_17523, partial [Ignelater luminosus]
GGRKTSSKSLDNNVETPEEVLPLPKAPPRKIGRRGRGTKPGKTRIFIITPEKPKLIDDKQTDCPMLTHAIKNLALKPEVKHVLLE